MIINKIPMLGMNVAQCRSMQRLEQKSIKNSAGMTIFMEQKQSKYTDWALIELIKSRR